MKNKYYSIKTDSSRIYMKKQVKDLIDSVDGLILDCDGVLIDNFNLYYKASKRTIDILLSQIYNEINTPIDIYRELKEKALFNNDWIVTFCIMLSIIYEDKEIINFFISLDKGLDVKAKLEKIREFDGNRKKIKNSLHKVIARITSPSVHSISNALSLDISLAKLLMNSFLLPMTVGKGFIPTVFEEIYHGRLFDEIYGLPRVLDVEKGLIEMEHINISEKEIANIYNGFNGKIGIISGRPRKSAEYSLSPILNYISESLYLEDGGGEKYDPTILQRMMMKLKINNALVVGDSAEEIMIVRKARAHGLKCLSCGVTNREKWRFKLFKSLNADIICDSVKTLFNLLR